MSFSSWRFQALNECLPAVAPSIVNGGPGAVGVPPSGDPPSVVAGAPDAGTVPAQVGTVIVDQWHLAEPIEGNASTGGASAPSFITIPRAPVARNFLMIRNSAGAGNLYVSFGNAASLNSALQLVPGATALFDEVVPQGDVYVFSDTANVTFSYSYSTIAYQGVGM